jgi:hypothetical protein
MSILPEWQGWVRFTISPELRACRSGGVGFVSRFPIASATAEMAVLGSFRDSYRLSMAGV